MADLGPPPGADVAGAGGTAPAGVLILDTTQQKIYSTLTRRQREYYAALPTNETKIAFLRGIELERKTRVSD